MLFWNEHELVEFFGVLPEVLRAGEVYIDLFQAGREEPAFFTKIKECPGFNYIKYPNGWETVKPYLRRIPQPAD